MLVFKIAWRNILRHKGKSLVIGIILFMGALLMVLGNATSNGMNRGIEENMVKSFTGHVLLCSDKEEQDDFLFPMMPKPMKLLQEYDKVQTLLKQQDYIKDFLPMTRGGLAILGEAQMSFLMTYGCNFEDFQRVFGSPYEAVEGELLQNGDSGLMINLNGRKVLHTFQGFWLVPEGEEVNQAYLSEDAKKEYPDLDVRHELAVAAFGETNASDDLIPIRSIVKFKSLNGLMEQLSIIDIETYRRLFGYFTAEDIVVEIPVEEKVYLESEGDDFLSGDIYAAGTTLNSAEIETRIRMEKKVETVINYDSGAFNYISVVLNEGETIEGAMNKLNKLIKDENLQLKVVSWRTASGQVASLADVASIIIGVFVYLLFGVAAIIIANTLSMTAMERTEEFGMMRAVGARKGFIIKMFLSETFFLAFIFGGLGILFGVIVTWIIRPLGISAGGIDLIEIMFGGETFKPTLGFFGLVGGVIQMFFVTSLAVLYPLWVARKITPLDAINRQ